MRTDFFPINARKNKNPPAFKQLNEGEQNEDERKGTGIFFGWDKAFLLLFCDFKGWLINMHFILSIDLIFCILFKLSGKL